MEARVCATAVRSEYGYRAPGPRVRLAFIRAHEDVLNVPLNDHLLRDHFMLLTDETMAGEVFREHIGTEQLNGTKRKCSR